MDRGARISLVNLLRASGVEPQKLVAVFLHSEAFADLEDYLQAVRHARGIEAAEEIRAVVRRTIEANVDENRLDWQAAQREAEVQHGPIGFLVSIPEADFLSVIESAVTLAGRKSTAFIAEVNRVCERRGIPYRLCGSKADCKFEWRGDPVIDEVAIAPALTALGDRRLSSGASVEFDGAREELRRNSPESRKRAVGEACSAVESTMKVLLEEHGIPLPTPANLSKLSDCLIQAGIVEGELREMLVAAGFFGNRKSRHGGGYNAHEVGEKTASTVVASAAVAISYLASKLP